MDLDSDEENVIDEDFYSFLNLPKEATKEEINNAYRRLSLMYHPDKHVEQAAKEKAEVLFNKTKRAYEVLSDPHRRAIYDSLGMKGLETEGWEIVQRTKTPAEIRAEYEQLAEERAERKKQQRTNPSGNITVSINATDLFNPYDDDLFDDEYEDDLLSKIPNIEVSSMQFTQSVDFPLTQKDTCTLAGSLQTQNGTGGGGVNLSWRHIFSHKSWAEVEMTAGVFLLYKMDMSPTDVARAINLIQDGRSQYYVASVLNVVRSKVQRATSVGDIFKSGGPGLSLKGFRTISKRFFWNGGTILQFTPDGIRPGIMSTLAMQIDKHSVGYITYHGGIRSLFSTSVVRDTENNRYNFGIQVGVPHSHISLHYTRKMNQQELKLKMAIKVGTFGGIIEYGAEKKISKHSQLSFAVACGVPSGVKLKIRLTRASQVYSFPIHLCEEIMPAPVFYASIVPIVVYIVVKKGFVEPFLKEEKSKKVEKQKQNNFNKLIEKRKEAMAAQELMTASFNRIRNEEENKKGLVIVKAIYGKLIDTNAQGDTELSNEVIDVTVPVQCLVKDSKLVIYEHGKSELAGFFDPALGEDKMLHIIYNYRDQSHEVTIPDNESIRLPKTTHRTNVT